MKKISQTNSGRSGLFALFLLFTRFADHGMTCPGLGMKAFCASRRFSAWLRGSCRGTQLSQKGGHGPTHLPQRQDRAARLPGPIAPVQQGASQQQLFVEAIAVLLRVAQARGRADLGQGSGVIAFPHEPTDPGVTGTSVGPMTDDLHHAHLDPARRAQMQVLPTPHLHPRAFGIASLPHLIRFAVGPLVAALEAVSILATGTQLAGTAYWRGTVKDAMAFDTQEAVGRD